MRRGRAGHRTSTRSNNLAAGKVPFFEPGLPELLKRARAESGTAALHHRLRRRGRRRSDVHFICVGTPQQAASNRRGPELRGRRRSRPVARNLTHDGADRRQVDRAGRHRCPAAGAGRRRGAPDGVVARADLEPGVPPGGQGRAGHPAPRSHRASAAPATGRIADDAGGLRPAARGGRTVDRAATCRRPNWSRSARTRSWPRRSRSSTRSRRSAIGPTPTSRCWRTRSATTSASAGSSSTPASGSAAVACPRTSGR